MHRNLDTPESLLRYNAMIGKVVRKKSGKPFKSKSKQNTVKGIAPSMQPGISGFTFVEDDSIVECWRCTEVKN